MYWKYLIAASLLLSFSACKPSKQSQTNKIEVIASSDKQWTGVAVSKDNRLFVNYPKWSNDVPISVAEIVSGKAIAFPNQEWNNTDDKESFQAVQSVVVDEQNKLWVLDTKNPLFQGVLEGGPKLYVFNLNNNEKEKVYQFPEGVYQANSYFNDVRVDTKNQFAYMTDSGNGALIVLNLQSGESKRVLDHHYSTESEVDHLICDGIKWENSVHSDGIALSPDKQFLYYIALTGHSLYRVPTETLRSQNVTEEQIAEQVEMVKKIPATDGMMFDKDGNLWLGGLEDNSINVLKSDGNIKKLIKDEIIRWADSFAIDTQGNVFFTTSQIHLPEIQRKQYQVLKLSK
ncbi:L-dopachrome tautomerase-related protein [Marinifilum sp. D714]|uniref:L-dopachrome tautomerase-related protein n=1 Tax=Marinifilum sp. D714 TaxID=2937523 RepID=UPI0027CFD0E6|nr:L-dopachrome tautomerase-related protein [Marinifilum sp. D714]MDQ2177840.1 major royal jelly family protein [Marinifilum sp. D714]